MNPSRPFILRPIATSLLMMAILLVGLLGFHELPIAALPEVEYPTMQVITFYPGANSDVVASAVTAPLERQLGQVPGLNQMLSTSSEGASVITLQFNLSLNIDVAEQEVQEAINSAQTYLPAGLPAPPIYNKVNPADAPILTLALTSDSIPLSKVEDYTDTRLAEKISQLPGVGAVTISGGQKPAVRVQVNPTQLAGYGLSMEDVRAALGAASLDSAKGSFDGPNKGYQIDANDQLTTSADYSRVVIAYRNGAPVLLKDVAHVVDGIENVQQAAWMNKTPAVIVNIQRQPGANIIQVVDRIKALLPKLRATIPSAIAITVLSDRTVTVRASVSDVEFELMICIVLVVAVIFLFLRSAAGTLIPSVAVPLSLIGTFAAMYALGYSLNNLTLMALTISTGFVVDDAIVMIENISRYVEQGEEPLAAALKGAEQIGFTIMSLTVSLIAVLIPLLFMGDITGRLFREFAITLSVTILISAVVSLTLTPMLCSRLLRHKKDEDRGRFYRVSERAFKSVIGFYERTLHWVLRRQPLTLAAAAATLGLTMILFLWIPKGFFPVQDDGEIQGVSEADQDVSFPRMASLQQDLAAAILGDPAVESLSSFIGVDGTNTTLNSGRIQINLKPLGERGISASDVIRRLQPAVAKVAGITLYMQPVQDISVEDIVSRTEYQYTLEDPDAGELSSYATKFVDRLKQLPQLADVADDLQTRGRQLQLSFDRITAARVGVTPQAIDDTLYDSFGQRQISTVFTQLNQYHVILEVDPSFQTGPQALDDIYLKSATGGHVPISAVTTAADRTAPTLISHMGQFPSTTVSFNLTPRVSLGSAVSAIRGVIAEMPQPAAMQGSFQGTAQAFVGSLTNESFLILSAIATVYIVLGVLYESYIHPITILSTLPSAAVGALLGLLACGSELTVVAIIGIVLLIGIVQKNAIMMIDFALAAERNEGKSADDAITQACLLRFRPILMTTMAAMLGAVPLALGQGIGSELRRPLGVAIIGGLIISQILTLYTTPVIYLFFDRIATRIAARRGTGAPQGLKGGASAGGGNDPLRALHPASDRHDAPHRGGRPLWPRRVPVPARVAASAGGLSHALRLRLAARREPGDHGVVGGHAAGARVRPDRGSVRDDGAEHPRADGRHAPVRPQPEHRRRRARRGGGDQRGAKLPPVRPAGQSGVPQAESGRRADHDPGADVGLAAAAGPLRCGLDRACPAAFADPGRRPGDRRRELLAGRPDRRQSRPDQRLRPPARGRAHCGSGPDGERGQGKLLRPHAPVGDQRGRPADAGGGLPPDCGRVPQWRSGAPLGCRRRHRLRADRALDRPLQRQAVREPHHIQAARRQHHRNGGRHPRHAAPAKGFDQPEDRHDHRPGPDGDHTGVGRGRRTVPDNFGDTRGSRRLLLLREVRATIIPSVAVPVSILGTLGVMYLAGYSVDNFSLMALTISTGFVVDDAIVVLENIMRYREQGLGRVEAAMKGAGEIGSTVLTMSISLVAVFTPILLMGGIMGRLFREFAVVLSVTILVSLMVSLTATPMMCSRLPDAPKKHGWIYRLNERAFNAVLRYYESALTWVLRHSLLVLMVAIATLVLNVYLFYVVPKGFFPQQDTGRLTGNILGDQDTSFQAMADRIKQIVKIVQADPAIDSVVAFSGGGAGTTINTGRMFAALKPLAERKATADQIVNRLRPKLAVVPGAALYMQAVQDVRISGRSSAAQYQYTLQSDNLSELNHWGPVLLSAMRKIPVVTDVNSDQQNNGLAANLVIDRATASRLGITPATIDSILYDAFGEREIATRYTPINQYYTIMDVAPEFWQNPSALSDVYVSSSSGGVVPLSAFTHFQEANATLAVNHSGVFPSVTISFNLAPGVALGDAVNTINAAEHNLGMPTTITGAFSGTAQAYADSLSSELVLIIAALGAVYIVLGMLYESYIHPITILSTLPSAGVGALLALMITRTEMTLIALIGIILLIGLVKKNAIMMIDFALAAERQDGLEPKEAIFKACILRFRPIMMTTMAALLGGLPLALGTGMGAEMRRPLGITIVGGLIMSQAMTLFTTPVIYLYMDRLNNWFARITRLGMAHPPRTVGPASATGHAN